MSIIKLPKTLPLEEQEQMDFIKYLNAKKIFYFAPMGENKQSFANRQVAIKIASKAKKMGKIKGLSDVIIMLEDKILFIELKRARYPLKSGKYSTSHTKVSKEQKEFTATINESFGYAKARVCYGAIEAIGFVEENLR